MTDSRPIDSHEHEAIAARAYQLWQRRGCPQGSAEQDWLEAEAQLRAERRARLEAAPSAGQATPVEAAASPVTRPEGAAEAPKRRRRATAAATATPSTGTRVVRKRPARPDA
ncbi:MAG: DUF2934 domain-containing protein [Steroidobacteraceae bacterium]|jgi:hypothetical protein|nr:DUF2934 domain-containing protein [Steroidobacteraceae bacterium]